MRVLVIQLRRIGDILLTTPVLSYLKSAIPSIEIDFLSDPVGKNILETNPHIHSLFLYDKSKPWHEIWRVRQSRYDAVLDFFSNPRSSTISLLSGSRWRVGLNRPLRRWCYNSVFPDPPSPEYVARRKLRMTQHWLTQMKVSAPEPTQIRPQIFTTPEDEQFATHWRIQEGMDSNTPFAVFVPPDRHSSRQWPLTSYREAALHLVAHQGLRIYLAWGPGEEEVVRTVRQGVENQIFELPPTTLRQYASIVKQAQFVLSNDAGLMHTAVAVRCPTVTIYGPTRPIDWNPSLMDPRLSATHIPVQAAHVPCLGCHLLKCPLSNHPCMNELSVDKVVEACIQILKKGVTP